MRISKSFTVKRRISPDQKQRSESVGLQDGDTKKKILPLTVRGRLLLSQRCIFGQSRNFHLNHYSLPGRCWAYLKYWSCWQVVNCDQGSTCLTTLFILESPRTSWGLELELSSKESSQRTALWPFVDEPPSCLEGGGTHLCGFKPLFSSSSLLNKNLGCWLFPPDTVSRTPPLFCWVFRSPCALLSPTTIIK